MKEFYFPSGGGCQLHCGIWAPDEPPRAIVQLVHGIAEHIGRYDEFASWLAQRGFLVVAEDHMGHGKTAQPDGSFGIFTGGWEQAVADVHSLFLRTRSQYPETPYFLLGHSMGSFLTRSFLITYPEAGLTGVILSGTGQQPAALVQGGLALCALEAKRLGRNNQSDRIQSLIFGAYNKQFAPTRTENDWICTDPAVVDAYEADPLCGWKPSIGMAADMLHGIAYNQKPANLSKMDKTVPVLFFSGSQDPVGSSGKGVRQAAESFRKAGVYSIRVRLYEGGRHEMLNEPNHLRVYADVLDWMEEILRKRA